MVHDGNGKGVAKKANDKRRITKKKKKKKKVYGKERDGPLVKVQTKVLPTVRKKTNNRQAINA
jgi:hypothetical protein